MKVLGALTVALCCFGVLAQEAGNDTLVCPVGYWGVDCLNYCGYCNAGDNPTGGPYDRECDPVTGNCPSNCQGGWEGENCNQAVCPDGCNGGDCIAPGECGNCPDISHVSPGCTNIKLRGLLGSLIALIVLTLSLTGCGLGAVFYEKRKSTV